MQKSHILHIFKSEYSYQDDDGPQSWNPLQLSNEKYNQTFLRLAALKVHLPFQPQHHVIRPNYGLQIFYANMALHLVIDWKLVEV